MLSSSSDSVDQDDDGPAPSGYIEPSFMSTRKVHKLDKQQVSARLGRSTSHRLTPILNDIWHSLGWWIGGGPCRVWPEQAKEERQLEQARVDADKFTPVLKGKQRVLSGSVLRNRRADEEEDDDEDDDDEDGGGGRPGGKKHAKLRLKDRAVRRASVQQQVVAVAMVGDEDRDAAEADDGDERLSARQQAQGKRRRGEVSPYGSGRKGAKATVPKKTMDTHRDVRPVCSCVPGQGRQSMDQDDEADESLKNLSHTVKGVVAIFREEPSTPRVLPLHDAPASGRRRSSVAPSPPPEPTRGRLVMHDVDDMADDRAPARRRRSSVALPNDDARQQPQPTPRQEPPQSGRRRGSVAYSPSPEPPRGEVDDDRAPPPSSRRRRSSVALSNDDYRQQLPQPTPRLEERQVPPPTSFQLLEVEDTEQHEPVRRRRSSVAAPASEAFGLQPPPQQQDARRRRSSVSVMPVEDQQMLQQDPRRRRSSVSVVEEPQPLQQDPRRRRSSVSVMSNEGQRSPPLSGGRASAASPNAWN